MGSGMNTSETLQQIIGPLIAEIARGINDEKGYQGYEARVGVIPPRSDSPISDARSISIYSYCDHVCTISVFSPEPGVLKYGDLSLRNFQVLDMDNIEPDRVLASIKKMLVY